MNMMAAIEECLAIARARDYDNTSFDETGVDYEHLMSMYTRIFEKPSDFSDAKLGRWLGYIQGVLVANACITLEEAKDINMRHRE